MKKKIISSPAGYKTIVKNSKPSVAYVRVSDASQKGSGQKKRLKKSFPKLDSQEIISHRRKGDTSVAERFRNIPDNRIVGCDHPDRVTKTNDCLNIASMIKLFGKRKLKLTFPKTGKLIETAESFWRKPGAEKFLKLVSKRHVENVNPKARRSKLKKEDRELIRDIYLELIFDYEENPGWGEDHLFWGLYAYAGYAVNQVLSSSSAKAREKSDNTFGTKPEQIKLASALEEHQKSGSKKPLKKLARDLARNRELVTKGGGQYKHTHLSRIINQYDNFENYMNFDSEVDKVLDWIENHEPDFDDWEKYFLDGKPRIKETEIRKVVEEFGFSYLYKGQYQALKLLLKGESVILETRTGGGKNDVPIMYQKIEGGLIVVVQPTLPLIENYRSRLLKHFKEEEIAVYTSKTGNAHLNIRRNLREGRIKVLVTTPDQLSKPELMEAIKPNGKGLLFFDECHNFSFTGFTYRKVYQAKNMEKIIQSLDHFTCLFASATVDNDTYADIKSMENVDMDCKYVSDSLSRPNLELFRWEFANKGMKMLATDKLLSTLKHNGLKKGIIYFSTVSGLLRFKEVFEQLDMKRYGLGNGTLEYLLNFYFGKAKKGYSWRRKKRHGKIFSRSKDRSMLATCSFGEGLDFSDVQFVICFDMPGSLEELYQWVGRAGRNKKDVPVFNAPVFLMDDPQGRISREILIESDRNDEQSKKFQRKKYNTLSGFLEDNPQPSMEDLVKELE